LAFVTANLIDYLDAEILTITQLRDERSRYVIIAGSL
jgi:hypothetical protein